MIAKRRRMPISSGMVPVVLTTLVAAMEVFPTSVRDRGIWDRDQREIALRRTRWR